MTDPADPWLRIAYRARCLAQNGSEPEWALYPAWRAGIGCPLPPSPVEALFKEMGL